MQIEEGKCASCSAVDFEIRTGVLIEYHGAAAEIVIPNSVTSIGEWAFSGCRGLTSVMIPDSVTRINEGAFENCTELMSVTIPDRVTSIDDSAFSGCEKLMRIMIGNSVSHIGYKAFYSQLYISMLFRKKNAQAAKSYDFVPLCRLILCFFSFSRFFFPSFSTAARIMGIRAAVFDCVFPMKKCYALFSVKYVSAA